MSKRLELRGTRHGMLTVLEIAGKSPSGKVLWLVECDCGKKREVVSSNLKNGNTTSCGCQRQKVGTGVRDLRGQRFNMLTVLERDMTRVDNGKVFWNCLCDCGETTSVWMGSITTGDTKSCGCLRSNGTSDARNRKMWSKEILSRDKECVKCGSADRCQAHHILSFAVYVEHRYDIENGATLCYGCHKDFHKKYGVKCHAVSDTLEFVIC